MRFLLLENWYDNYMQTQKERIRCDFQIFTKYYYMMRRGEKRIAEFGAYPYYFTGYLQNFLEDHQSLRSFTIVDVKNPDIEFDHNYIYWDFNHDILSMNCKQDMIVCSEVFEHLYRPDMLSQSIQNSLATGGIVILTTPNLYKLENVWHFLFCRGLPFMQKSDLYKRQYLGYTGHVREYTTREICSFFDLNCIHMYRKTFRSKNKLLPYFFKRLFPFLREHQTIILQKKT